MGTKSNDWCLYERKEGEIWIRGTGETHREKKACKDRGRDWMTCPQAGECHRPLEAGRDKDGLSSRAFRESGALLTPLL